jgi:ferredoxin
MARTDANPPMMPFTDEYTLVEVDADYLSKAVKPKQFIHIDQSECISCEGCVDICPWKCIHMVATSAVVEAQGTELPGTDPSDAFMFTIDDDICTRCALCVDRCPTGVIILGKAGIATAAGNSHVRTNNHGYGYGMRL